MRVLDVRIIRLAFSVCLSSVIHCPHIPFSSDLFTAWILLLWLAWLNDEQTELVSLINVSTSAALLCYEKEGFIAQKSSSKSPYWSTKVAVLRVYLVHLHVSAELWFLGQRLYVLFEKLLCARIMLGCASLIITGAPDHTQPVFTSPILLQQQGQQSTWPHQWKEHTGSTRLINCIAHPHSFVGTLNGTCDLGLTFFFIVFYGYCEAHIEAALKCSFMCMFIIH